MRASIWGPITSSSWNATYQTWTSAAGGNEKRPVNCANWFDTAAFCVWDGGFVPSEAEWNYAAAGGSEQRVYSWSSPATSSTLDSSHAVYNTSSSGTVGSKSTKGDARWGHSDLTGNVYEWALDWFKATYNETRCANCAYLAGTVGRVTRDNMFGAASNLVTGFRNYAAPTSRQTGVGARCARVP